MTIQIDSREHQHAIQKIIREFERNGVDYFVSKLPYGDYMSYDNPRLVVDRKQNLSEVCQNVCQDHDRFRRELVGAAGHGIKIVVLVEHGEDIASLEDVIFWENPRKKQSPKAIDGVRLYKILSTIQRKYGVEFQFCNKEETGSQILRILGDDNE